MKEQSYFTQEFHSRGRRRRLPGLRFCRGLFWAGQEFQAAKRKAQYRSVGIGGMGKENIKACEGENIVALCDVDWRYAGPVFQNHPNVKKYKDFRKMFDEVKDIDAVIVATPDHTHAVIAMAAIKMGKHVYVQKPLTWSIEEARKLTVAAGGEGRVSGVKRA